MKSIFITGSTGFVGNNVVNYFSTDYDIYKYVKNDKIIIDQDVVLHFAGKAHDLKNVTNIQEYYFSNTELTKNIFDAFLESEAKIFITLSSVKAIADELDCALTEDHMANPITHYGKSKLLAEKYILNREIPQGKRVYILRPAMIHGPGNKGNLNLLYKFVRKGWPWPLGSFDNKRSFCSIDNLIFVLNELIENNNIPSGAYNISDNETLSTNEIIKQISQVLSINIKILKIPKFLIFTIAKIGDLLHLPFNSEKLNKLTKSYIVCNKKLLIAIDKPFPVNAMQGLTATLNSLN